ncbi:MAG TPA: hypothetical protein VKB49_24075 [Candidatus Sulfotelmatobacter sp.]|nr:hypothetical protein [Candidatus Sulfotelmatobacter sp.]
MTANEAVEKILALRQLTTDTGCVTRRSQSELLASLPGDVLTEVALKLRQMTKGTDRTNVPQT